MKIPLNILENFSPFGVCEGEAYNREWCIAIHYAELSDGDDDKPDVYVTDSRSCRYGKVVQDHRFLLLQDFQHTEVVRQELVAHYYQGPIPLGFWWTREGDTRILSPSRFALEQYGDWKGANTVYNWKILKSSGLDIR